MRRLGIARTRGTTVGLALALGLTFGLALGLVGCGKYGPPVRAERPPEVAESEEPADVGPVDTIIDEGESEDRIPATLGEPVPIESPIRPTGRP